MGIEVGTAPRAVEVLQELDMSPAKRRAFLGYLVEQAYGITGPMSTHTAADYRRLQREHGLVLDADALSVQPRELVRLDWDSGEAVRRAA